MEFDKNTTYRLTELNNCFVIGRANAVVPSKDAKPLIIADPETMIEYLSRYMYARAQEGKGRVDAHTVALNYVGANATLKPEKVL